ncbi:hypothetical protein [Deinococcus yavapaiensis]|uniref:Uncharacterized protein n=1 Tax=Deinococcus yavapaiensis KR-236 TaxID=694435 RepID=A0A318S8A3_9DEIO|nr:hypothetical protein [Deinococcus yavapaiensis]PYE54066.1 hypothetical protein DES52_10628 [Deinococcus yavapaiensis KR-236]
MTTMPVQSAPEPSSPARPNYWVGFVLNWFLPGCGFTYINRVGWHFGWMGIFFGISMVAGLLSALLPVLGILGGLLSIAAFVAMHVHYRNTYAYEFAPGTILSPVSNGLKWGLIVAHGILGFLIPLSIVAAVLIPNLLGARATAQKYANQAYAQNVYKAVAAAAATDEETSSDCLRGMGSYQVEPTSEAMSCVADFSDPSNPTIQVAFRNGQEIQLP